MQTNRQAYEIYSPMLNYLLPIYDLKLLQWLNVIKFYLVISCIHIFTLMHLIAWEDVTAFRNLFLNILGNKTQH
jgi:hypothetical protein